MKWPPAPLVAAWVLMIPALALVVVCGVATAALAVVALACFVLELLDQRYFLAALSLIESAVGGFSAFRLLGSIGADFRLARPGGALFRIRRRS